MRTTCEKRRLVAEFGEPLAAWLAERRVPRFRHDQILNWYRRGCGSFADMTDLPQELRSVLEASFVLRSSRTVRHLTDDDGTEKLLLEWSSGGRTESVLLRDGTRRTVCLSSQVGCAMGCVFCASGIGGVERDLARDEIIEQAIRLVECLPPGERLSHVVMMGMGEPLANLDELLPALAFLTGSRGLGISRRRVTISTVGLPHAIRRLADEDAGYHLAVSLHAATDRLRSELVPVNRRIGLEAILAAAEHYFERTGRRLTFEYVLLGGVNDGAEEARRLAQLLRHRSALVNLIPYNEVVGLGFRRPAPAAVREFRSVLERGGLTVQIRRRKGSQIKAACGQLRHQAVDRVGGRTRETLSGPVGVES